MCTLSIASLFNVFEHKRSCLIITFSVPILHNRVINFFSFLSFYFLPSQTIKHPPSYTLGICEARASIRPVNRIMATYKQTRAHLLNASRARMCVEGIIVKKACVLFGSPETSEQK